MRGYEESRHEGHTHWHMPKQREIMNEALPEYDGPLEVKSKGLHWYQWIVYTIVVITCVAVLIALFDAYRAISAIQDALSQWGKGSF